MTSQGTVASGADYDQAARRRNVPTTPSTSGKGKSLEIDDKKAQAKKVSISKLVEVWCHAVDHILCRSGPD